MSNTTTTQRIKFVYDLILAVEMAPAAVLVTGNEPLIEPNGKSYCELARKRAGVVVDSDTPEKDAIAKAIRTAAFFFKQDNPEWKDSRIVGLSPERVKAVLVR